MYTLELEKDHICYLIISSNSGAKALNKIINVKMFYTL